MFRFKIAIVGSLSFLFCATAQTVPPKAQMPELPVWLASFPGAHDEHHGGSDEISSVYRASRPPGEVVAYYREQLGKSAIRFNESFDGIGTVIRCSDGKEYCVIQIHQIDEETSVKVGYSSSAGSAVSVIIPHDPVIETPVKVGIAPAPPKADAQPGSHQIEYVIDGTAGAAGLTYRNAGGGTEQNDVALPTTLRFRTIAGAFVYISAQKKSEYGTVRVEIRVDGVLMRQSTSSAPFGIASASGRVVDRKVIY